MSFRSFGHHHPTALFGLCEIPSSTSHTFSNYGDSDSSCKSQLQDQFSKCYISSVYHRQASCKVKIQTELQVSARQILAFKIFPRKAIDIA